MATIFHIQSNFNRGELDPRLIARVDTEAYYKGARRLRNVVVQPQGSIKRRFGTRFLDNINNRENITQLSDSRLEVFRFGETYALFVFVPGKLLVYQSDEYVTTVSDVPWTATDIPELSVAQSFDSMIVTHASFAPVRIAVATFPTSWTVTNLKFRNRPTYDFTRNYDNITFNVVPYQQGNTLDVGQIVALQTNQDIFGAQYTGGLCFIQGGAVRIQHVDTNIQCRCVVVQEFAQAGDDIKAQGTDVLLTEPAFSATRGWPRTVTFYQSRLVFGGTNSLPTLIAMSNTNDFENFDDSGTFATNGITVLLNSDQVNKIEQLASFTTLIVFTDSDNFALQAVDSGAVTPETVAFAAQDKSGVSNVKPAILDNQVFYVERGGNIVRAYTYNISNLGYSNVDVSVLSQSLIKNPQFIGVLRTQALNDGNYLFLANEDGTLAIFQTNKNEDIAAWTLCNTQGKFGAMANIEGNFYFIVERFNKFYLEKLDYAVFSDSTNTYSFATAKTQVTGLTHLEDKLVQIKADGFVQTPKTVNNGIINLDTPAKEVAVGLAYTPEIIPMPVALNVAGGNTLYLKQRIRRIFVDYFESLGVIVDGQRIPDLDLDTMILDTAPTPVTGFSELTQLTGWDARTELPITQNEPVPMTILSIAYEVEL